MQKEADAMEVLEQLQRAIEEGHPGETERLTEEALDAQIDAAQIVEGAMMPAMRRAGELYKSEEADILRILAAARSVRKGFEIIEKRGITLEQKNIGTIILGTVEGDLHDVGKNLVAIMFRSAGFKVIDLGVDISEKQFLRAVAKTPDVSIVCISSLLSTALPEMEQVVRALRRNDPERKYRIMVGGGAVTKQIAEQMGADAYTENCVEAAEVARTFLV
jgi:5-methyltetrahydrofolate--homocysteine methyltransferase